MLKKIFKRRINEIHEEYRDEEILMFDDMANFLGQESLGALKVRGNGVLLLTKALLFFGMWKPKKEILIPVSSMVKIQNPKSYLHKSVFRPLLKVVFKNQQGEIDSAAWYVAYLDEWNNNLNKLISKNKLP
jgi:hypothetical protein